MGSGSDIDCRLDSQRRGGGDAQSGTCLQQEPLVQQEGLGQVNAVIQLENDVSSRLKACHVSSVNPPDLPEQPPQTAAQWPQQKRGNAYQVLLIHTKRTDI